MFACSQFYNQKTSFNNNSNNNRPSSNKSKLPSTFSNNNNNTNILSMPPDNQRKFEKHHEASLKRYQFQQELQRRHQLCAEKERLHRERAEKKMALKKAEECNALRKFYELKSAQLKRSSSRCSSNSSFTSDSSISSSTSSFSSLRNVRNHNQSRSSISSTIKTFQAAYKIHSFIKFHIERRRTQKIISQLIKLRLIQNRLSLLKSIKLRCSLTFDLNSKTNQILPISQNNKAFLIYKESILKILAQLNGDFSDELFLVRERKMLINNIVNNMLRDLELERDSQYTNFIKNIKEPDDDFVIINRNLN